MKRRDRSFLELARRAAPQRFAHGDDLQADHGATGGRRNQRRERCVEPVVREHCPTEDDAAGRQRGGALSEPERRRLVRHPRREARPEVARVHLANAAGESGRAHDEPSAIERGEELERGLDEPSVRAGQALQAIGRLPRRAAKPLARPQRAPLGGERLRAVDHGALGSAQLGGHGAEVAARPRPGPEARRQPAPRALEPADVHGTRSPRVPIREVDSEVPREPSAAARLDHPIATNPGWRRTAPVRAPRRIPIFRLASRRADRSP